MCGGNKLRKFILILFRFVFALCLYLCCCFDEGAIAAAELLDLAVLFNSRGGCF